MLTTAILAAAGPGIRLGTDQPKAFVPLDDAPLFVYALRGLTAASTISSVVLAVPADQTARATALLDRHGPWRCAVSVVPGGAERQDSVRAGLFHSGHADLIAIHDAARPFITAAIVDSAVAAAAEHGAAIVAIPATDTVKIVSPAGWVESTTSRERVWLAQTPQVFRADILHTAHAQAAERGVVATDDAALVEQLGRRVHVVAGNPANRKITTREDLEWAEWMVANRKVPR